MNIDKNTGLPELPWPKFFWRVVETTDDWGDPELHVELRRKRRIGSKLISWKVASATPASILYQARWIFDGAAEDVAEQDARKALVGDYPPKKLESK